MSGVIDASGQQWEHCGGCLGEGTDDYSPRGRWVRIEELRYEPPSEQYPYGRDLCATCATERPAVGPAATIDLKKHTITFH